MPPLNLPSDERGPWRTRCGHLGVAWDPTLDETRPRGRCMRLEGGQKGCGRVILTTHPDEAEKASVRYRWMMTTRTHSRHDPEQDPQPFCWACDAWQPLLPDPTPGTDTAGTSPAGGATGRRP